MSRRNLIAAIINYLFVIVAMLIGIKYLIALEITSYHQQAIGIPFKSLNEGLRIMLMILMKGTGLAAIVAGASVCMLLLIPYRRGENWSRWGILLITLILLVPFFIGALYVSIKTGASSPWWLNLFSIISSVSAFFIAKMPER